MNVLVPLSREGQLEATIASAVGELPPDGGHTLHLVYTDTSGREDARRHADAVLERGAECARRVGGGSLDVRTASPGRDRYLATPMDHVAVILAYADRHDVDVVVVDPGHAVDAIDPALKPFAGLFDGAGIRVVHADVPARRWPTGPELGRAGTVAVLAGVFYWLIAGSQGAVALGVGVLAAIVTGALFRNVTFESVLTVRSALLTAVRGVAYVPYLFAKILVANVQISYLILHPSLPIDPHLDRIATGMPDGLTVTSLANSITLTPGTLTVDAERADLLVHSLTPTTRREVLSGERSRAIEFVFFGRGEVSPADGVDPERVETLEGPTDAGELDDGREG